MTSLGWPPLLPRYISLMSENRSITPLAKAAASGAACAVVPQMVAAGLPVWRSAILRAIWQSGAS